MPAPGHAVPDGRRQSTYLITFSCYGQHLHGDERGSVDRLHNQPGSRLLPEDEPRHQVAKALMKEPAYSLDANARAIALETIKGGLCVPSVDPRCLPCSVESRPRRRHVGSR